MRAKISKIEAEADAIIYTVSPGRKRTHCSGPEARAALKLRILCEYLRGCFKSSIVIQKYARRYVLRSRYLRNLRDRCKGVAMIQRVGRGMMGRNKAALLRLQQQSDWEQLWDVKRSLLYYFNCVEVRSTYEEPDVLFRPLVRDRRSARLVQSWPYLDQAEGRRRTESDMALLADSLSCISVVDNGDAGNSVNNAVLSADSMYIAATDAPLTSSETNRINKDPVDNKLCGHCGLRKILRRCSDCAFEKELLHYPDTQQPVTHSTLYPQGFPLCFPCFNTIHDFDKADHKFSDVAPDEDARPFLQCSMCSLPATRKCIGVLTSREIEDIVMDLTHAGPERWLAILQNANVGSDEKIGHMLNVLHTTQDQRKLTSVQLQQITGLLERSKAECDDCYCASCYMTVHTKGKRALHKWKGFREFADMCVVCTNAPAELNCSECNSKYCDSCFGVFHNMGRKKRHKRGPVVEEMSAFDVACEACHRRMAEITCSNTGCDTRCCDSCFECVHKPRCDYEHKRGRFAVAVVPSSPSRKSPNGALSSKSARSAFSSVSSRSSRGPGPILCVSCGEVADRRCVECGDYYCSNTWMGNIGCFAEFHARGNRMTHTIESFEQNLVEFVDDEKSSVGDLGDETDPNEGAASPSADEPGFAADGKHRQRNHRHHHHHHRTHHEYKHKHNHRPQQQQSNNKND
jgi:hypothetical protein